MTPEGGSEMEDYKLGGIKGWEGFGRHAVVWRGSNGRGTFLWQCRCGQRFYGASPGKASDKLTAHIRATR